jgi:hypothetical protein
MRQLKRIAGSVVGGATITVVAQLLYAQGGEIVAVPGIIISGWIDLIAYIKSGPDEFPHVLSWQFCSIVFYSVVIYGVLLVRRALRSERQQSIQSVPENLTTPRS